MLFKLTQNVWFDWLAPFQSEHKVQINSFVLKSGLSNISLVCLLGDLDSGSSQVGGHTHTKLNMEHLRSPRGMLRMSLASGLPDHLGLFHFGGLR